VSTQHCPFTAARPDPHTESTLATRAEPTSWLLLLPLWPRRRRCCCWLQVLAQPPPPPPIDAPCTQYLRHGDPMNANNRLTAALPGRARPWVLLQVGGAAAAFNETVVAAAAGNAAGRGDGFLGL
jgi:hypothetical protein